MKILVTGREMNEERLAILRKAAPDAQIMHFDSNEDMEQELGGAHVVAGRVTEEGLARADKLEWVHTWSAGPDAQLFPAFARHLAVLTCSKGSGAIPLAERVMLMILALTHDLRRSLAAQAERRWEPFFHAELPGTTIGIIGAGNSGLDLAQKAKAFHMRVLGVRRRDDVPPFFDTMYRREQLHEFLAECDFIVVTAPRTPETTGMLGAAEFAVMKPSAYYLCISRGGIADDGALLDALTQGTIAGAGLDAHGVEPLPPESPFWALPNVIVSAHNGATTKQNRERRFRYFLDNLKNYLAGKPFFNVVDKEAGY